VQLCTPNQEIPMKTKTNVKAGGLNAVNHSLKIRSNV
jgi:hypothetical protein